jgi:hypothetical protein
MWSIKLVQENYKWLIRVFRHGIDLRGFGGTQNDIGFFKWILLVLSRTA